MDYTKSIQRVVDPIGCNDCGAVMSSTVRIPWQREFDNEYMWNEVCAWAIEYFGLPGDRFKAHANVHHMDYVFKSNKDALMMALQWNAQIVPNDELTVEAVGRFL